MSTVLCHARALGRPRTKGSLKAYCMQDAHHKVRVREEVEESKKWRMVVARAVREYQLGMHRKLLQHPGPVEARLHFYFDRIASVNGGPLPTHETPYPTHITLGDSDKLARNVLDALSSGSTKSDAPVCSGLLLDDSQVVRLSVAKDWSTPAHLAGVEILVLPL